MAMVKYCSPTGWNWDLSIMEPVLVTRRGLVGHDKQAFEKRASPSLVQQFSQLTFQPGEVPVHINAIGATESFGANLNGDGFSKQACREYHRTFVKYGSPYRDHKNKPELGHPRFGLIKAAAYNEAMSRLELLVVLNATKEAADRNGGLVADRELQKLASQGFYPTSMACHVAHDVCSYCGTKAANRSEYCTAEKCAAGGCQKNLGKLIKMGSDIIQLYVDNPQPRWFDISDVFTPADRISRATKADYFSKAAADLELEKIAQHEDAEHATAPFSVVLDDMGVTHSLSEKRSEQLRLAYALAQVEQQSPVTLADAALQHMAQQPIQVDGTWGSVAVRQKLAALADQHVFLSLSDFAQLCGISSAGTIKSAAAQSGVYSQLCQTEHKLIAGISQDLLQVQPAMRDHQWAAKYAQTHSLRPERLQSQAVRLAISQPEFIYRNKIAEVVSTSDSPAATQLAQDYALYKLAAIYRAAATASASAFPLTVRLALRHNRVC